MLLVLSECTFILSQDEMQKLRLNFLEVAEENRLLHEELKRGAISEILGEGLEVPGVGTYAIC